MENHPIPQNVTGFQFKLIGDMTIKQFVYLASGVVSGWFFFSLPIIPFIKLPISTFFILTGITFAFMPVAGRPIDIMVANFIRSFFAPTQYVYRKTYQDGWLPNKEIVIKASSTVHAIQANLQTLPKTETKNLASSSAYNSPIIISQPSTSHIVSMSEVLIDELEKQKEKDNESLKEKEQTLEEKPEDARTKEAKLDKDPNASLGLHQKVLSLEEQLQEILGQKEQLAQQIVELEKKLNLQKKTISLPTTLVPKTPTQNVRIVPANMAKTVGLPLRTDAPNVITGIVTDPRGNPLPNILVEIKDKEGNPVRAFKTSVLGQFASAKALSNGVYVIEFEDPKAQNKFDTIELNVTGEVIIPIEVKSIDTREELRKSLFGKQAN